MKNRELNSPKSHAELGRTGNGIEFLILSTDQWLLTCNGQKNHLVYLLEMQILGPRPPGISDSRGCTFPGFPSDSYEHLNLSATDPTVRGQKPHRKKHCARLFK